MVIAKNHMAKTTKHVLKIARHQTRVIMTAFVQPILEKIQRIVLQIVGRQIVIEMEYAKAKMEKILLLALKIVDVTMMAYANQNEEKIQIPALMIVNHPPVIKTAHASEKTARMKPTVPATASRLLHLLSVIIMECVILENIGLHAATVHHVPWPSQTMTTLPMLGVL
jgi:hypothetical protein